MSENAAPLPSRFRSEVGTGVRRSPKLNTTISRECDALLRAHCDRTGAPMGRVVDAAIRAYLSEEGEAT